MSIKDWPADDRPREKLIERGAASLSDAELLAIFLRVGLPGVSAVDLARQALDRFGSLTGLTQASLADFSQIKGFGEAKYVQLQAAVELSRRALGETLAAATAMDAPATVKDFLRLSIGHETQEVFGVLFLDAAHRHIGFEILFRGTLNQASVYPREVVKAALERNAAAVVLAHNHPSGAAEPSPADMHLTRALTQALALIDVKVVDHIIVAKQQVMSFSERGLL
jgi:DNA repair protein RadC